MLMLPSRRPSVTGAIDMAPFLRVLAIACSMAALSLPSACTLPFTTACGV